MPSVSLSDLEAANLELKRKQEANARLNPPKRMNVPAGPMLSPERVAQLEAEAAADKAAREAQKQADEVARRKSLWENSGVPGRHAEAEIRGIPEWQAACEKAKGALTSGCILAILGKRGTGKTQIAVECIRYATSNGGWAVYHKAIEIFLDIREAMRTPGASEKKVLEQFTRPQVLVIDAMEVRGETQWEDRMLDHIIDLRYDSGRDTILISNQTKDAFSESVGPSIVSRIKETGSVIECTWNSFREARHG